MLIRYYKKIITFTIIVLSILVFNINLGYTFSQEEIQLFNLLNQLRTKQGLKPLIYSEKASFICRQHSLNMKQKNFFSVESPNLGSIDYQLQKNSIFDRVNRTFIFVDHDIKNIPKKITQMKDSLIGENDSTHIGIGIVSGEGPKYGQNILWITLVFLERIVNLNPVPPVVVKLGQKLTIKGEVEYPFVKPEMPVTLPNGNVKVFKNELQDDRFFSFTFSFDQGNGKYNLEIMVTHPNYGPKVAAIIPIYAGINYPPPNKQKKKLENFKTTNDAAKFMINLVNSDRQKFNLKALKYDQLLSYTAYYHSKDMATRKFFAHINPDGKGPTDRYKEAGGVGYVSENIAYDKTIQDAQIGLMESPGHRANILDKNATHIGIGVYFDGKQYYITQLFKKVTPIIDTYDTVLYLIKSINEKRVKLGKKAFFHDSLLSNIASEHSKDMAFSGNLNEVAGGIRIYDRFIKHGGKYNKFQTLFYMGDSVDSLKESLLKDEHLLTEDYTNIGIGIYQKSHNKYGENLLWVTICLTI